MFGQANKMFQEMGNGSSTTDFDSGGPCGKPVSAGHDPALASSADNLHTSTMTIKTAAFLALVGMVLLTVLVTVDFIATLTGVLHDVVPAMALLRSLVHLFASFAVTVFFYVFHRAQT